MYHVAAKSVPKTLDPFGALIGVYATALLASVLRMRSPAAARCRRTCRLWHPTVAAVGLGALMIELGFLLTYRAAWPVSIASVMTNGLSPSC